MTKNYEIEKACADLETHLEPLRKKYKHQQTPSQDQPAIAKDFVADQYMDDQSVDEAGMDRWTDYAVVRPVSIKGVSCLF